MKRELELTVFVFAFIVIYGALNYFVLFEFSNLLDIERTGLFYIILVLLTLSYIVSMSLERIIPNKLTKMFYIVSAVWMGILFISFTFLIIFKIISLFIYIPKNVAAKAMIYDIIFLSILALIKGHIVRTKNIEIKLKNLKKDFKIVQLSDIHLGTINQKPFLEKIVERTNSLKADVVVITGDLIDGSAPIDYDMVSPLNKIKAPVFYIIGNHEIYDGLEKVIPILQKTKMKILRDESAKWKEINFIGIDYHERKKDFISVLSKIKIDKRDKNILLYHSPQADANLLNKYGIKIHLSGHTHHGQMFPFNFLVRIVCAYVRGLNYSSNKETAVYVSPGTGTWGPPMRLGTHCEITLINVKRQI